MANNQKIKKHIYSFMLSIRFIMVIEIISFI